MSLTPYQNVERRFLRNLQQHLVSLPRMDPTVRERDFLALEDVVEHDLLSAAQAEDRKSDYSETKGFVAEARQIHERAASGDVVEGAARVLAKRIELVLAFRMESIVDASENLAIPRGAIK